jgi:hypothetical protein
MNQMGVSLQHFLWYAFEREDVFNRIVTGGESRVRHYQTESNCVSMQWKYPSTQSTKKLEV